MSTAEIFQESAGDPGETVQPDASQTPPATPPEAAPEGDSAAQAAGAPEASTGDYEADWLKTFAGGKYRTIEAASKGYDEFGKLVQTKAAALKELEAKVGDYEAKVKGTEGILGAPVDSEGKPAPYEFKMPEGVEMDSTLKTAFEEFCRGANLSNAVAQKALEDVVIPWEAGSEVGRREAEKAIVVEALGGDEQIAAKVVADTFEWASSLFGGDKDKIERLQNGLGKYGEAILALADLREALTGVSVGRGTGGVGGLDEAGYQEMLRDPNWMYNEAKTARVMEYLERRNQG